MRLFFTTDIHGSDICWRKFVNAGKFYEADVLVLGGDVIGKAVMLVEDEGGGNWRARRGGRDYLATEEASRAELLQEAKNSGFYPYVANREAAELFRASEEERERVFEQVARESIASWVEYAELRLDDGMRIIVTAGNDDPMFMDDAFASSGVVEFAEGAVCELPDGHEMISIGWANPTPWETHRECGEDELAERIATQVGGVSDLGRSVFNLHVPPIRSGLDDAPALSDDLRPQDGGATKAPVGSTAVRDAIEQYEPLVGLHGHIHEARGATRIGRTVCINPGSVYGQGLLSGAVVVTKRGKLRGYQLVEG